MTRFDRWTEVAIAVVAGAILLLVGLGICGHGFLPRDDALRHAAFAVDDRAWSEVMLMRTDLPAGYDSHPGWHAVLKALHRSFGWDQEDLVVFAMIACLTLFGAAGAAAGRAPLAWLLALAIIGAGQIDLVARLALGRPVAVPMAALVALLFIWTREEGRFSAKRQVAITAILTVSIWLHPSWYLWALPGAALLLCRRWTEAARFGGALVAALVLASLLSGSFSTVVTGQLQHMALTMGQDPLVQTSLVYELQSSAGSMPALIIAALVLIARRVWGYDTRPLLQPDFVLFVLCWILGLAVVRFWADWGLPALLVWLCRQLAAWLAFLKPAPWPRLLLAGAGSLAIYLGATTDIGGRYSATLRNPIMTMPADQLRRFLPDDGGIAYNNKMEPFFSLYYRLPHGKWKYFVGFESGLMAPEDLQLRRQIQYHQHSPAALLPLVQRLRPQDRLILQLPAAPNLPGVQFEAMGNDFWSGRLAE